MSDCASQIETVIGSAPEELLACYQNGNLPTYPDSRINCLPFEKAKEYSQKMKGISVVDRLGLWVLDDANDSNPFAYISKGPCTGMIIHFSHDPEPQMEFSSLSLFVTAMHNAGVRGLDIDEIEKASISVPLDQAIRELTKEGTDDATFLLRTYLSITSTLQKETKDALVAYDDFFVREAFSAFLAKTPSAEDVPFAEQLANDKHPQVAQAGKAAVSATKRKRFSG
ncbi:MAG TPA: hypothetical protein VFZ59_10395 [Verrucomicrobiae bacterium]|nr:hypothetical protein [Verrucomicrobiae bacterium]